MVRQEGIEPPTHSLEGCCSIQLSYWRFMHNDAAWSSAWCSKMPHWPLQVGAPGFEPGTSCSQSRRDTRLRYAPRAFECIRRDGENQLDARGALNASSSAAMARARWLTRAFSSGLASPNVHPNSSDKK